MNDVMIQPVTCHLACLFLHIREGLERNSPHCSTVGWWMDILPIMSNNHYQVYLITTV